MLDDEHDGLDDWGCCTTASPTSTPSNASGPQRRPEVLIAVRLQRNLKFDTNEYQQLADGSLWLHQAWSGDMAAAPLYAPKGLPPTRSRYWWPEDGRGPINNDMVALVKGGKNPVLAHLFLNHVLDVEQAFTNFEYIYYQQPLNAMTPEAWSAASWSRRTSRTR